MKKLIIASITLILILLFTIYPKTLATYNTPIYEEENTTNIQKSGDSIYNIFNSQEQMLKNMQELSEFKPRDPKGAFIMIIITITGAIIIVLISWWYKTNIG